MGHQVVIYGMMWPTRRTRFAMLAGLLPVFINVQLGTPIPAADRVLFDFEKAGLSKQWSVVGKIGVSREILPEAKNAVGRLPDGHGVSVVTGGRAGLFAKSGQVPKDWSEFQKLSFWIYRDPQEAQRRGKSSFEVRMIEVDGKARFWRRVDVDHAGWKNVTVSLNWFRWGNGRIPRWDRIDRFGFWFRDAGQLSIDTVLVTTGETKRSAFLASEELVAVAFPEKNEVVRILKWNELELMTNAANLQADQLSQHLRTVARAVRKDFPFFDKPARGPPLIVFATREQYQAFVPRFAKQLNAVAGKPNSSGYSLHGVSTSYWDEQYGTLRPVYTHEFVHSILSRGLRLASKGDWLHEGTASLYQLRFHPQKNIAQVVNNGISNDQFHLPLRRLCNGDRIPTNRYWQAATLIEMLLKTEKYHKQVPALYLAFRKTGSTNLEPHLASVLKADWERLTEDWKTHCRLNYPVQSKSKR